MLKLRARFLMAGAVGLSLAVIGTSAAQAATSVGSDAAKFAGVGSVSSTGVFSFRSTSCGVVSDTEQAIPCQLSGSATLRKPITGAANLASADGTTAWKFTLTPVGTNTFVMKGAGMEADAPENGKPSPKYPAKIVGKFICKPNTSVCSTFTGSLTVSESSTAP